MTTTNLTHTKTENLVRWGKCWRFRLIFGRINVAILKTEAPLRMASWNSIISNIRGHWMVKSLKISKSMEVSFIYQKGQSFDFRITKHWDSYCLSQDVHWQTQQIMVEASGVSGSVLSFKCPHFRNQLLRAPLVPGWATWYSHPTLCQLLKPWKQHKSSTIFWPRCMVESENQAMYFNPRHVHIHVSCFSVWT